MDPQSGGPPYRTSDESFSFVADGNHNGLRLDHFLVEQLPHFSRSQLTSSVKKGLITVDGQLVRASRKLQGGEKVCGRVAKTDTLDVFPQKIEFDILYEDQHIIGLSKPPGLVVHPAGGNPDNTLVNGLLYHCCNMASVGDSTRPGIVHRLDKDTSGAMVVAKSNETHRFLVDAFKNRQVKKRYHALVIGVPRHESGRIVASIGRHPVNRKKMSVREYGGKYAASNWRIERVFSEKYSLLKVEIETGRTHQIRVHLASIGHPVAGDTLYGLSRNDPLFPRQMLHSSELRLDNPIHGKRIRILAPVWQDMSTVMETLGEEP